MAGLVFIGIIVVMLLVLFVQMLRKKRVKKLLISYAVILSSYYLYVTFTCGPNSADVRLMKPQAEAISNYILKNGIPESLNKISGLPYALEGCSKQTKTEETCSYRNNNKLYTINFYRFMPGSYTLRIDTAHENGITRVAAHFEEQNNGTWILESLNAHLAFGKGLCNPMRQ